MVLVDAGDQDGVDLHDHPAIDGRADPPQLLEEEQLEGLRALIDRPVVGDAAVDLLADRGIDGVDRDGHRLDAQAVQAVDPVGQEQTVRRDTPLQLRMALVQQFQGLEGLLVGQ